MDEAEKVNGLNGWIEITDTVKPPVNVVVLFATEFWAEMDWRIKSGFMQDDGSYHVWGASWTPTVFKPHPPEATISLMKIRKANNG